MESNPQSKVKEKWQYESSKEYYQEVLKDVKTIYVVGVKKSTNRNWDAGHWNTFSMYFINKQNTLEIIWFGDDKDKPAHWKKTEKLDRMYHFKDRVLGMDRIFDIVYGLGMFLFNDGYKFKEEFLS